MLGAAWVPAMAFAQLPLGEVGDVGAPGNGLRLPDDEPVTIVEARRLEGINDETVQAYGNVRLYRGDTKLEADRLIYRQIEDEVEADGQVLIAGRNFEITTPRLKFRLADRTGFVEQPSYRFFGDPGSVGPFSKAHESHGRADRVTIEGENHYSMDGATFSTCKPGDDAWFAKFSRLNFDYDRVQGEGYHARVIFHGVPIFYTPYINFPLSRDRRSGFLAPTFGTTSTSGTELALPYYWNIAPNLDATFTPHTYSRRGHQLGAEFRYLMPRWSGTLEGASLPDDLLRESSRWSYRWQHQQTFLPGLTGAADLARVSDDFYFKDLATDLASAAQTQVAQQATLGASWRGWTGSARVLRYQTLQPDSSAAVQSPYALLPQVQVQGRTLLNKYAEASVRGDFTHFVSPDDSRISAQRTVVYPRLEIPWRRPGYFLTPRFGVHATHYAFSTPVAGVGESYERAVPIASLDGGLVFEREAHAFGRQQLQTLEPRVFYVKVPYRDQTALTNANVNFDSGPMDFGFAQIFTENEFSGHDRVADADQLTAALSTRLVDERSGREYFRATLGQRFFFKPQKVTLSAADAPRTTDKTDVIGAVGGELLPNTFVDSALQYNPQDDLVERYSANIRYQPEAGRVLNAGYRFSRTQTAPFDVDVKNLDFSGQWPVLGRWQAVGRYNYSVKERRVIETLAGVEYSAGCWSTRLVAQRFATSATEFKTAFFWQLELTDFGRLGPNPMSALNASIPGYSKNFRPSDD